jgi:hypothetical protein
VKERNRNKTHQQRFQGRHDQPLPPPVETEKPGAPFGPDLDNDKLVAEGHAKKVEGHGKQEAARA